MNRLSTVECHGMYRHTAYTEKTGRPEARGKSVTHAKIQIVSIYTQFGELLAIKMLN